MIAAQPAAAPLGNVALIAAFLRRYAGKYVHVYAAGVGFLLATNWLTVMSLSQFSMEQASFHSRQLESSTTHMRSFAMATTPCGRIGPALRPSHPHPTLIFLPRQCVCSASTR